ncbi:MAG TPA: aldehyde dehydrogenase family protein [Acidimicrobiia bacterium]|nr:aldehyde dehydrogenase family protein [Acidimicrobiia bacterium]
MSDDDEAGGGSEPERITLEPEEARVVGALAEKSLATPENYPLSLNGLVTACNQSTNREPVVAYDEATVERALEGLREKQLARRIKAAGQRVVKHRHVLDETLRLNRRELALVTLLLLRGPQTPGELKTRSGRLATFDTLADVEAALRALAEPTRGFVGELGRRPGQKENRWGERLTAGAADGAAGVAGVAPAPEPTVGVPSTPTVGVSSQPRPERAFTPSPATPRPIPVRNPATGALIRELEVDDDATVATKVRRARAAQAGWAARSFDDRAVVLLDFVDRLEAAIDDCAATTTSEMGKPITQARNEIRAVRERVEFFVEHVPRIAAARTVTTAPELEESITYDPAGVVAHVSAWNYPYFVGLNSIVPALLAGNAVIYKPSELASLTGLRITDVLHASGVPVDVMQAAVGAGPTGAAVVESNVDVVCFTGSYATGRRVAAAAAERLARAQLELGGKDPAYVCDDVDIARTATAVAEGVFYNAGQSCCAIERVYVHERIFDAFVDAFVAETRGYVPGDPTDPATTLGPLARAEQPALLAAQVADAVARGARVVADGGSVDGAGNFFAPVVLVDVDHSMTVMREESFGPVIGIQRVASDSEAARLAADTEYGLTAAIFTDDRERADHFLAGMDSGTVYWNCSDRTTARLPWAGRGHSGLGVSLGDAGIHAFLREKARHSRPPRASST